MSFIQKYRVLTTTTVMVCAGLFSSNAQGQMEYMAEAMQPEYFSRDLVVFAEGLNLDDTQEVIVEAMFDSYEDDFEMGWANTQERLNSIADEIREKQPATSRETLEPVLNVLGDWLEEKRMLDVGLLENVNAILIDDQRALWPSFIRKLYREKHISRGRLSGESVDLFQTIRDSALSPAAETAIAAGLEEYDVALDSAMRKRDDILRGNPKKLFDDILNGNVGRNEAMVDEIIKARKNVRDINDRYIEIISSSLSEGDSEDFRIRSLKRGYPRIFRRTPAERLLRQAAENQNYGAEVIAQILQLEGAYLIELAEINHQILTTTRSHEPEMHKHREVAGQIRKNGGTPEKLEDPTRDLYKEREELGNRYIEMLRALLSGEQFLELDGARRWIPRDELPAMPTQGEPKAGANPEGLELSTGGGAANKNSNSKAANEQNGIGKDGRGRGGVRGGD